MSKYLIQGNSLISIADEIRGMLDSDETMDIKTMKAKLKKIQQDITNAFAAVEEKGGLIPAKKISDNLAEAIGSILISNGLYASVANWQKTALEYEPANIVNWQKTALEYEPANIVNWQKTALEYEPAVYIRNVELEVNNETQN